MSRIKARCRVVWIRLTILAILLFNTAVVLAQETTPEPLYIPTSEIFQQTNNWITVFAPIVAIGAGISIALAILNFVVKQIVKSFHKGGR